uniref:Inhibitor of growth protein n=1 Tax=Schizaphis graminum TaxID=13262 RepID=A0A2S2PRS3_SCHGA
MVYFEDFLEKLNLLPQEFQDHTSKIGPLDLNMKTTMNCLKESVEILFSIADTMNTDDLDADFKKILEIGDKALKQSDEQMQLVNKLHELMVKYINQMDIDLDKFRMDLEADNMGITEKIEKKVEDELFNSSFSEKSIAIDSNSSSRGGFDLEVNTIPTNSQMDQILQDYTLEHMEDGSSVVSSPAPKVKVTPKKSVKVRKSAKPKTSIIANNQNKTNAGSLSSGLSISNKLQRPKKYKKRSKNSKQVIINNSLSDGDNMTDPGSRRYCICNDIAYSTMIGCDNKKCPYEWFHFKCVGIKSNPRGKWFCPICIKSNKKTMKI